MTFTYTMSNGQGQSSSASAQVTFNVPGPNSPGIFAQIGAMEALPLNPDYTVNQAGKPALELTGLTQSPAPGAFGVGFIGSATLPPAPNAGTYSWVQLINRYQYRILWGSATAYPSSKTGRSLCGASYSPPVLDTVYPYATFGQQKSVPQDTVIDIPLVPLTSPGTGVQDAEANIVFSATMFLMWTPSVANSIPVPLASVNWSFGGDAVNTMTNQTATFVGSTPPTQLTTTFFPNPCSSTSGTVQQPCTVIVPSSDPTNFGYPVWTANWKDTPAFTCTDF